MSPSLADGTGPFLGTLPVKAAYLGINKIGTLRTNAFTNPRSIATTTAPTVRTNVFINPSAATLTNWTLWAGYSPAAATIANVSSGGVFGSTFNRVTWTTATDRPGGGILVTGVSLSPNTTYTLSMWVRSSVAVTVLPQYQLYNGATPTTLGDGVANALTPNVWTRQNVTVTSGAADTVIQFRVYASNGLFPVGATFDGDACLIEASSVLLDYFDGTYPLCGWNGAANVSTSYQKEGRVNLALNPRATLSGASTFLSNDGAKYIVTRGVAISDHPLGFTTAAESHLLAGVTGSTICSMYNVDGLLASPVPRNLSIWVKVNAAGYKAYWSYDTGANQIALEANTWTLLKSKNVVATNAMVIVTKITGNATPVTDSVLFTGVLCESASTPLGSYFDGSYSPSVDKISAWTGTANASASTLVGIPVAKWFTNNPLGLVTIRATLGSGKATELLASRATTTTYVGATSGGSALVGTCWSARVTIAAGPKLVAGRALIIEIHDGVKYISSAKVVTVPATGTLDVDAISTAATAGLAPNLYIYNREPWGAGESVIVSNVILEQVSGVGVAAGTYFDGQTDTHCKWSGTADSSTSTRWSGIE